MDVLERDGAATGRRLKIPRGGAPSCTLTRRYRQYDCVEKYLDKRTVATGGEGSPMNPVLDAITQTLGN